MQKLNVKGHSQVVVELNSKWVILIMSLLPDRRSRTIHLMIWYP